MIFNLMVLLLIVLITLYLAGQGMVSALLALVTATFSSLLAMGLTEPLEFLIGKIRIEYQRGLTFLLLFLFAFALTRFAADYVVTKNIKLPLWVNRAIGGLVGFFTALVVVGTLVIGIEMLPLPSTLLGYNRFPGASNMQGDGPGVLARPAGVWLSPDRFTLSIWNGASGRSLGGNQAFADVHPDLSVESYGYRRKVQYASKMTVPPENFDVPAIWSSADPKDLDPLGIKIDAGKRAVVARTVITKGEKPERSASDVDERYFRVTPSQVRLVTDRGNQYYPIGFLEFGNTFTPVDLDGGQVVDDFVSGKVVEDWVFLVNEDERPSLVEVKQTARKDNLAANLKDKPVPALASREYPQKPYQKERSALNVTIAGIEKIAEGTVFVLRQNTVRKDVSTELSRGYETIVDILAKMDAGTEGWSTADKPGAPTRSYLQSMKNVGNDMVNKDPKDAIDWGRVLQVIIAGQMKNDPAQTMATLPPFVKNELIPLFGRMSTGSAVIARANIDASGKAELRNIPKGSGIVFAVVSTPTGYYVWVHNETFEPTGEGPPKSITLQASGATAKVEQ